MLTTLPKRLVRSRLKRVVQIEIDLFVWGIELDHLFVCTAPGAPKAEMGTSRSEEGVFVSPSTPYRSSSPALPRGCRPSGAKALPSFGVQSLHSCRKIASQTMLAVLIPTGRLSLESIPLTKCASVLLSKSHSPRRT
jgi:hypothetical protein